MRKLLSFAMALALALLLPGMAFAANGNGSGGGNGGGGGNGSGGGTGGGSGSPLVVSSASIEDGGTIAADGTITLVFSKNVCEAGVRDANKTHASVQDAQGANVAVVVELADDQVEPNKKNDMVIGFEQPLAEGSYTLTVKAGVESKSGDTLAEDYVLAFNVGPQEATAAAPAQAASASASAASASASSASASASASAASSSSASTSSASSGTASGTTAEPPHDYTPEIALGIGIVIAAGAITSMVINERKRKKQQ